MQLVHSLYTPIEGILPNYNAQCIAAGINPNQQWREDPLDQLDFTDDPGVVVLLDRTFGSLEQEIQFTWSWAAAQQHKSWWWPDLKTDPEHLFLRGNTEYPSWRQRLVRIRRTANYGQSPENVLKGGRQMSGREIISMLAQHPEVARRMDGSAEHPFLWMAGLECKVPGDKRRLVPNTGFYAGARELFVRAHRRGLADPNYAVPEYLGE